MIRFFFLLFALTAVANAEPKQADIDAYRALVAQDLRLATIGYRLAQANAPFCSDKSRNPGWVLHSYRQYPDRETAHAAFSFPTSVAIAALVAGGPADRAGLKAGEGLLDMPDGIFWPGELIKHKPSSELIDGINGRLSDAFASEGPVTLTFGAFGADSPRQVITLDPPLVCASHFEISTGGGINAGADGKNVRMSVALADYAPDDDEFAAVVAHEFSHNILQHRKKLNETDVKRGIGRLFGKSKKAILATEIEADRLSVWLMANAGYDPRAALRFWERYGRQHGKGIFSEGTHLRWKKRVSLMQAEIDLIDALPAVSAPHLPPLLAEKQLSTIK